MHDTLARLNALLSPPPLYLHLPPSFSLFLPRDCLSFLLWSYAIAPSPFGLSTLVPFFRAHILPPALSSCSRTWHALLTLCTVLSGGGRKAAEWRGGEGRLWCLVKPLGDRVMHTASSSTDSPSDGYEWWIGSFLAVTHVWSFVSDVFGLRKLLCW